jgi:hypothetical protein
MFTAVVVAVVEGMRDLGDHFLLDDDAVFQVELA